MRVTNENLSSIADYVKAFTERPYTIRHQFSLTEDTLNAQNWYVRGEFFETPPSVEVCPPVSYCSFKEGAFIRICPKRANGILIGLDNIVHLLKDRVLIVQPWTATRSTHPDFHFITIELRTGMVEGASIHNHEEHERFCDEMDAMLAEDLERDLVEWCGDLPEE